MTSATRPLLGALLLLCAAPYFAQAEEPPAALRKGDAFFVRIEGIGGGLPEYREIVDSDGKVELPFLGFLPAEGKSISQLESEMAAAYVEARLATNAAVHVTYAVHFEPPPARANLVRVQDPRRPAAAAVLPAAAE